MAPITDNKILVENTFNIGREKVSKLQVQLTNMISYQK
jgi:hypothetical protein